jgi:hypothetical protein
MTWYIHCCDSWITTVTSITTVDAGKKTAVQRFFNSHIAATKRKHFYFKSGYVAYKKTVFDRYRENTLTSVTNVFVLRKLLR